MLLVDIAKFTLARPWHARQLLEEALLGTLISEHLLPWAVIVPLHLIIRGFGADWLRCIDDARSEIYKEHRDYFVSRAISAF